MLNKNIICIDAKALIICECHSYAGYDAKSCNQCCRLICHQFSPKSSCLIVSFRTIFN